MGWLWLAVYVTGWLVAAVAGMRFLANRNGICARWRDRDRNYCLTKHGADCWQETGDVTATVVASACGAAVLWPIVWLPALAYALATRRPTPAAMAARIRQLEQEVLDQ